MSNRSAFTLIDTLIALVITAILASMVLPRARQLTGLSETAAMAETVRLVRSAIRYHAAVGDVEVSKEGFPKEIHESWFRGQPPQSYWTGEPFKIQTVHGPKERRSPNKKTYDPGSGAPTAWYNASNGSFCAYVPKGAVLNEDALFEAVNGYLE